MKVEKVQIVGASIKGLSIPSYAYGEKKGSLVAQSRRIKLYKEEVFQNVPMTPPPPFSQTFSSGFEFVVPKGVYVVSYEILGSGGGGGGAAIRTGGFWGSDTSSGGTGSYGNIATGTIEVVPGDILYGVIGAGGGAGNTVRNDNTSISGGTGKTGAATRLTLNDVLVKSVSGAPGGGGGYLYGLTNNRGTNRVRVLAGRRSGGTSGSSGMSGTLRIYW